MYRIISALRLLPPADRELGPLLPTADPDVSPRAIGDFLNATYVAVEKIRQFGLADKDFGGKLKIVGRKPGEMANGRYLPKQDLSLLFYPQVRGAPDWVWTIVHEVMHRIWVKHLDKDARDVWEILFDVVGKPIDASAADAIVRKAQKHPDRSNLWFYFNKQFGDDPKKFKQWLMTRRVSDSFPSDYSSADPAEAFSEVATEVILGRARVGKTMRRSGSMVRKVFLSLVGPLRNKPIEESLQLEYAMLDKDANFLQLQVDFYRFRWQLNEWAEKALLKKDILKLEMRPHVTLYYGADKRDLTRIREIVASYDRPIRMSVGALNIFEHEVQDVLYFEMVGDAMLELHKEIEKLPHTRLPTHPHYTPHLTVAYLKKGSGRRYIGTSPIRRVLSSPRVTVIDSSGIEQSFSTVAADLFVREPLLLAGP
jgi:2'-5' RNA ligase